jgi:hypothetical protein
MSDWVPSRRARFGDPDRTIGRDAKVRPARSAGRLTAESRRPARSGESRSWYSRPPDEGVHPHRQVGGRPAPLFTAQTMSSPAVTNGRPGDLVPLRLTGKPAEPTGARDRLQCEVGRSLHEGVGPDRHPLSPGPCVLLERDVVASDVDVSIESRRRTAGSPSEVSTTNTSTPRPSKVRFTSGNDPDHRRSSVQS